MRAQTERTSCSSSLILSEGYNTGTRTHAYMQTHTHTHTLPHCCGVGAGIDHVCLIYGEVLRDLTTWCVCVCGCVCVFIPHTLWDPALAFKVNVYWNSKGVSEKAALLSNPSHSVLNNSLKTCLKLYKNWKTGTFLKHHKNVITTFLVWVGDKSVWELWVFIGFMCFAFE